MLPERKKPYRVFRAGGRMFEIFCEYDGETGESCPIFPDFEQSPEYTADERPFTTADRDDCPHCKSKTPDKPPPGDCGGCAYFFREETPYDPIGVCMCETLRRNNTDENKPYILKNEQRHQYGRRKI